MHSSRRLMITGLILLVATGVAGSIVFSADANEWKAPERAARRKNPVPADAKSIAEGKTLYTAQCFACHGATGKGNGPAAQDLSKAPGDLTSAKVQQQTDGELFWKITEGRKPMPNFDTKLTDQQRWAVVNYLRTLAPSGGAKK